MNEPLDSIGPTRVEPTAPVGRVAQRPGRDGQRQRGEQPPSEERSDDERNDEPPDDGLPHIDVVA